MRKPDALRAALTAALPEYERDPQRLSIYIDEGRLAMRRTNRPDGAPDLAWEYRYKLRLFAEAFARNPDALMLPLLLWLRGAQPELLQDFSREDSAVRFAADILDDGSFDVAIVFELTEAVVLAPRAGGGRELVHAPEPVPELMPDEQLLVGMPPPLGPIWLGDDLLVP